MKSFLQEQGLHKTSIDIFYLFIHLADHVT